MEFPTSWLRDNSLGEKIASEVRLRIIQGKITAGSVLSENTLASEFGTSRAPVRDALKTLSNEGLIRPERMGALVLGLTPKDIKELYDIRFLIENFTLQGLAKADNTNLIVELDKIVDKMIMAEKHNDFVDFALQDITFHEMIIIEANHTRIIHLWSSIRSLVLTVLLVATGHRFTHHRHEIQLLIEKHSLLISALKTKDPDHIGKIIQEHFDDTRRSVSSILKSFIKNEE